MFKYQLPDGGLNTRCYYTAEGQIKFDPPVYEQRYTTALRILEDGRWAEHFKKVVDFGCGEMRMLELLRRSKHIEHILEVDIDESTLSMYRQRAAPLLADYLKTRERPLRIEVLQGSLTSPVENLRNVDAVICLEVIEHLYADVLDNVPQNIFGFVQPKLAVFSTPNSEFNVLFGPLLANGFRHLDHKFEWTRQEFRQWAATICQQYPDYKVAFLGVGRPPPDRKSLGYVTQIAIFARKDILGEPAEQEINKPQPLVVPASNVASANGCYKEIYAVDFPFFIDERSLDEKLWDEAQFQINNARHVERYYNREKEIRQIPLQILDEFVAKVQATRGDLLRVLEKNLVQVEGDFMVLPEDDEDERIFDDCHDDEYNWQCRNEDDKEDDGDGEDDAAGAAGGGGDAQLPSPAGQHNKSDVIYDSDECWD